jgi:hypothetical protein
MFNILSHKGNANQNDTEIPLYPVRMAIFKTQTTTNSGEDVREKGTLIHCFWECKLVQLLRKSVRRFLEKLKIGLSYDLMISLLGICLKECAIETPAHTFIVALFTRAKLWNQLRSPSTDE